MLERVVHAAERLAPAHGAIQAHAQLFAGKRLDQIAIRLQLGGGQHALRAAFARDNHEHAGLLEQIACFGFFQQVQAVVAIAQVKVAQHDVKRVTRQLGHGVARPGGELHLVGAKAGQSHGQRPLHLRHRIHNQNQLGRVRVLLVMAHQLRIGAVHQGLVGSRQLLIFHRLSSVMRKCRFRRRGRGSGWNQLGKAHVQPFCAVFGEVDVQPQFLAQCFGVQDNTAAEFRVSHRLADAPAAG